MGAARRCGASPPSLRHLDSEPARRRPRLEIEWALRRWGSGPPLSATLERDPEKWAPVFPRDKRGTRLRGDHAQTKRQIGMTIRRSVIPILESQPDRRAGTASNTDGTERCEAQVLGSPPSTIAPGRTYAGAAEGFASPGTISRDDRSGNQAPGVAHNHETRVRSAHPNQSG